MNKMILTLIIALIIVINTCHAACPFLGFNEFLDNLINLEFLQFSTPALRLGYKLLLLSYYIILLLLTLT